MRRATRSRRRPGWLVIIGGYDPEFIEALKRRVPFRDREWSEVLKAWIVRDTHAQTLADLGVGLPAEEPTP